MAHDLVGTKEIAQLLGITRQRVNKIAETHAEFPKALEKLAAGRVWKRKEILEWARRTGRQVLLPSLRT